ncbi:hypothetical protein KYY02_30760, partial [Streptomyces pimonensis]
TTGTAVTTTGTAVTTTGATVTTTGTAVTTTGTAVTTGTVVASRVDHDVADGVLVVGLGDTRHRQRRTRGDHGTGCDARDANPHLVRHMCATPSS